MKERKSWNKRRIVLGILMSLGLTACITGTIYAAGTTDPYGGTWTQPAQSSIPKDATGDMINYGKKLIDNTAYYLGPNSSMPYSGNILNCTSCHQDSGTKANSSPLVVVAKKYADPGQWSPRDNKYLNLEGRINGCFERSMNGTPLPVDGYEMQSMKAYLDWLATGLTPGLTWQDVKGQGYPSLPFLSRAADPVAGKTVFQNSCASCHGADGSGSKTNPALWGPNSYNDGAGMHRIGTAAARFIKANMPKSSPGSLTAEQAYDVAAYIDSQGRPAKANLDLDYSGYAPDGTLNIKKKPVDAAYGPYYPDGMFTPDQHKYGPWQPIVDAVNSQP